MRPRQHGKTASLVQIAAAIVGSAAATQVVTPVPEIVQRAHRPGQCWCGQVHAQHFGSVRCTVYGCVIRKHWVKGVLPGEERRPMTPAPQVTPPAASAESLDVHAALNTYEVAPDVPEGVAEEPSTLVIVGANHRRLIVRWTDEGVWVGGCLVTDEAVADRLAAFITREDEKQ